ncbi:TetR/AcrR family transcriptional regulator [Streptomyces sp. NPDC053427]|uniref:TetR/AcrR family transcriptional regulator n=1 Tax=Streptomyces sp. NPDC053427 TaxID=3365701 RepID=UPI0037D07DF4
MTTRNRPIAPYSRGPCAETTDRLPAASRFRQPPTAGRAQVGSGRYGPRGVPVLCCPTVTDAGILPSTSHGHPPEHVSMERIAAAAPGVRKGAVFHHFGSRAGLMRELMRERAHTLHELVTDGPPGPMTSPARKQTPHLHMAEPSSDPGEPAGAVRAG